MSNPITLIYTGTAEIKCPECGSTRIREWGKATVGDDISAVRVHTNPETGEKVYDCEWAGFQEVVLDGFTPEEYMCRECDYAGDLDDFLVS